MLKYRTCERDLITATHVCQHWRSALTGDPSLWTPPSIKFGPYLHHTLTYMQRSESDEINVDVTSLQDLDPLKHLTSHIARLRYFTVKSYHTYIRLPDDFLGHHASSLRSISLSGICPAFKSPFPLPNLTKFRLCLHQSVGRVRPGVSSVRMNVLFRFLSNSPLLESISVYANDQTTEDLFMDQVISLESVVELIYDCNMAGRVLPFLRLPRLKNLHVRILQKPGQMHQLVDVLPHNRHALLARATTVVYRPDASSLSLDLLSPNKPSLYLTVRRPTPSNVADATRNPTLVDWFSSQGCIPLRQIKILEVHTPTACVVSPIDTFALENLEKLEVDLRDAEDVGRVLRLFRPDAKAGVPCRSLRVIRCACRGPPGPLLEPLMSFVKERKGAGYQLEVVYLPIAGEFDPHFLEELREHVGKVRTQE